MDILDTIDKRTQEGFEIVCYALAEDMSPVGQFASGDDKADAKIIEDIRSGKLEWFCVKATASKAGVKLADTYLGGCGNESFAEFVKQDDYYADMRSEVIAEAQRKIREIAA